VYSICPFPLAAPRSRLGLAREHRLDADLALLDRLDERRRLGAYFADLRGHGVAVASHRVSRAYACETRGRGGGNVK
jgi:hypothetical protein